MHLILQLTYGYQSPTRKVIQSEFLLIRIRLWVCFNLIPNVLEVSYEELLNDVVE